MGEIEIKQNMNHNENSEKMNQITMIGTGNATVSQIYNTCFVPVSYTHLYMKIYIDGKLVVPERWRTAWNPNSFKFETPIKKGVKTPIRIE